MIRIDGQKAAFPYQTKRTRYNLLRTQLETERSSFISHWRDLSDFILPRRSRFFTSDVNRGNRRNLNIIDSTATLAARTLRSGMMGGITSPARPWFRLTTTDPDLANFGPVKDWLYDVSQRMAIDFLRSNIYNSLPIVYGDMGTFGTGAMMIEEDFKDVLRTTTFPIGSYMIANDARGKIAVFMRVFRMTVRQLVGKFGRIGANGQPDWSNFSLLVQRLWTNGQHDAWIEVCHVIMPNDEFDPARLSAKFKKYESCYYELGATNVQQGNYTTPLDENKYLRESGYDYFPVLVPRWEVTGEDVYGTDCPGMTSLGDIKQLQMGEKRIAQAIEKTINPPMVGPSQLKTQKASILPGDITFVDEREGQKGFRPAHEVSPRITEMENKQEQTRQRVKRAFYEDLFLMLAEDDRRQPATATEVIERKEEKLLAIGPVLEQLNQDLLDPTIDIGFDLMNRQRRLPPPPPDLHGQKLGIEYVSIMAQAQKIVGLGGLDKFTGYIGNAFKVTGDPRILDKVNFDKYVDTVGDLTGVAPGIVHTDEEAQAIRADRAKQQQAAAAVEQAKTAGQAVQSLSQAKTDEPNALTELMQASKAGQIAPQ